MSDNIWKNNIVTVGDRAWHMKDLNRQEATSAMEALDAMNGGHKIELRDVAVWMNGDWKKIRNQFGIVRVVGDEETFFDEYVTSRFHSFDPVDVCRIFDEKVGKSISSLGFIQEGKKMFLAWVLPSFEVIKGDEIKLFGNTLIGFGSKFASALYVGNTRAVCENTWNAVISEGERNKEEGRGRIYAGKHTNENMLAELGEWMKYVSENADKQAELVKSFFGKLVVNKIVHEQQAKDLIYTAYPTPLPVPDFFPDSLREKEQEKVDVKTKKAEEIRDGIWEVFSGDKGIAVDQDSFYGLFNSASQYWNYLPSKKDTSYSIYYGNRSKEINRFAEVLRDTME